MDKQKLIKQLFAGKVSEVLGFEKTTELLKEATDAINAIDVEQSEQLKAFCEHLNTYDGFEECRFDFMLIDFFNKSL